MQRKSRVGTRCTKSFDIIRRNSAARQRLIAALAENIPLEYDVPTATVVAADNNCAVKRAVHCGSAQSPVGRRGARLSADTPQEMGQSEMLNPPPQTMTFDVEQTRRLRLIAIRYPEHAGDEHALGLGQRWNSLAILLAARRSGMILLRPVPRAGGPPRSFARCYRERPVRRSCGAVGYCQASHSAPTPPER